MADVGRSQYHPSAGRRTPLTDATSRVNHAGPPKDRGRKHSSHESPPPLPHHESLHPNGRITKDMLVANSAIPVIKARNESPRNPVNPRIEAVAESYRHDANRDSQISSASGDSARSRRKTHVGPWRLGKTLGRGSSGRVRLAKHCITGQYAAIKIIGKYEQDKLPEDEVYDIATTNEKRLPYALDREIVIMKLIDHENVMKLYDVWENRGELYLVLEWVEGGELFDYIVRRGRLTEPEAFMYLRQLLAGLTYCHHFGICHRDLKPENILLDRTHKVLKICDFGMAALQREGRLLDASCGSPHYASPEIIAGKRYDGKKTDIWSLGIICFVLTTGFLPFDDSNVRLLMEKVRAGRYVMPSSLSTEAKELIRGMLQVNPANRLRNEEIWDSAFFRKYATWGGSIQGLSLKTSSSGPRANFPRLAEVGRPVKKRSEIDGELLRGLQTLWCGTSVEVIIKQLLGPETNREKQFYALLKQYRDKQREDYGTTGIEYSPSDYHHTEPRRPLRLLSQSSCRASQFSIVSFDRSSQRASYYENPDDSHTVSTYDPYRPSLNPIFTPEAKFSNVTILRDGGTIRARQSSRRKQTRVQELVSTHRQPSTTSIGSLASSHRIISKRLSSRVSLAASLRGPSAPLHRPKIGRNESRTPSNRQVHQRKAAGEPGVGGYGIDENWISSEEDSPTTNGELRRHRFMEASPSPDMSPVSVLQQLPATRYQPVDKGKATGHRRWDSETRQVSRELEDYCNQLFNRSSISTASAGASSATQPPIRNETPMSSFSTDHELPQKSSGLSWSSKLTLSPIDTHHRPLPLPPLHNTYLESEWSSGSDNRSSVPTTKSKFAALRKGNRNADLSDVIAHLDELMVGRHLAPVDTSRRIVSAPSEHDRLYTIDEVDKAFEAECNEDLALRSASNPDSWSHIRGSPLKDLPSIRVIQADHEDLPPPTVAPLTIRKRAGQGAAGPAKYSTIPRLDPRARQGTPRGQNTQQNAVLDSDYDSKVSAYPQPIVFNPTKPLRPAQSIESSRRPSMEPRKRHWFSRRSSETQVKDLAGILQNSTSSGNQSERSDLRFTHESTAKEDQKPRKASLFSRFKRKPKAPDPEIEAPQMSIYVDADGEDTSSLDDVTTRTSSLDIVRRVGVSLPVPKKEVQQRNWLSRLLNIKPITHHICLRLTQRKARIELSKMLKGWKHHGVCDIRVDKVRNVIVASIGSQNALALKEVKFVVECYGISEWGRKHKESIVRIRQIRGAASSLNKLAEVICSSLEKKAFVIPSGARVKKMVAALEESGQ